MNARPSTPRGTRAALAALLLGAGLAGISAPLQAQTDARAKQAAKPGLAGETGGGLSGLLGLFSDQSGKPETQAPKTSPLPLPPPAVRPFDELNFWPLTVERSGAGGQHGWQAMGPLVFSTTQPNGDTAAGIRPLWLSRTWASEGRREIDILYPFFTYKENGERWTWSVLNLVNRHSPRGPAVGTDPGLFDVWPFWFSRKSPVPGESYRGLFPVYGTMKGRLMNDRIDWVLFPFYGRWEKAGRVTYTAPWPFVRHTSGGGCEGWAVWPLAGHFQREGDYRSDYVLWPFAYRKTYNLSEPAGPTVARGIVPFYTDERGPGLDARTFVWPFFGYTHRTLPYKYNETRWLWPLWIHGRGDGIVTERWAPFYTHSVRAGRSKTWVLWPFWRTQSFTEQGLAQRKNQFLYFVWWDLAQRPAGAPASTPAAHKTHLWPLYSFWDNGAGARQLQVLSPFDVFFQHNETTRHLWSPLTAVYRQEHRERGHTRVSVLWNAVSFERSRKLETSRFRLGPLLATDAAPAEGRRVSLLCGLIGMNRAPGSGWKPFLFQFKRKPAAVAPAPTTPSSAP